MTRAERLVTALEREMPKSGLKTWMFDVALACDVHPDTVRRWCRGETKNIAWENYVDLCRHFGDEFRAEVEGDAPELTIEQHAKKARRHLSEIERLSQEKCREGK